MIQRIGTARVMCPHVTPALHTLEDPARMPRVLATIRIITGALLEGVSSVAKARHIHVYGALVAHPDFTIVHSDMNNDMCKTQEAALGQAMPGKNVSAQILSAYRPSSKLTVSLGQDRRIVVATQIVLSSTTTVSVDYAVTWTRIIAPNLIDVRFVSYAHGPGCACYACDGRVIRRCRVLRFSACISTRWSMEEF